MAYSNWGAFVYKNGERRVDCEDVPVFGNRDAEIAVNSGWRIFVNIGKNQQTGQDAWWAHAHHAVLGEGLVRLAGYKCVPEIWIGVGEEIQQIQRESLRNVCDAEEDTTLEGVLTPLGSEVGLVWKYTIHHFDRNMVDLQLEEPDGTVWTSRCGFEYGAGWMDEAPGTT